MSEARIGVIIGSVRPFRVGPAIAAWIADLGRDVVAAAFEIIDLADWPLPMDSEPGVPAQGVYRHEHTRAWSRKIDGLAAVVFVTPQYNWGYPASLKNALDHLYREWAGKPAIIVSYGGHGGGKCAGQLRQVLDGLKVATVATMPALALTRAQIEANDARIDPAGQFAAQTAVVREAFAELATALGR